MDHTAESNMPLYKVQMTPGQFALTLACLHDQETQDIDLSEIENKKDRVIIRQALMARRYAIRSLIVAMESVTLDLDELSVELNQAESEAEIAKDVPEME